MYDFHTHSTLSDGALSPLEVIRRAHVHGYKGLAITDHVGIGGIDRVAQELSRDCDLARRHWDIISLPGVEITHVPPGGIGGAAQAAREAGALVVVVHGETVAEPVEAGTNRGAIACGLVDVLAHPGLITLEDAKLAAEKGVFLELSAKPGHAVTNGHVARMARLAGARLIVDSDNHDLDFLTPERIRAVVLGAGLNEEDLEEIATANPLLLLDRVAAQQVPKLT
ncbi:MAG: histidinol phosphate phosphatase domain-containing protein [Chloroflexi bacterium]|nr:histidinol phosphate phosphatase domain-containing protein [Chloroflexota bacterium]